MGQTPSPNRLFKAAAIGVGLAVLGIVLFLIIYVGLSGVSALPRLMVSMCLPPLIIGLLIGGYALVTGRFSSDKTS